MAKALLLASMWLSFSVGCLCRVPHHRKIDRMNIIVIKRSSTSSIEVLFLAFLYIVGYFLSSIVSFRWLSWMMSIQRALIETMDILFFLYSR